MGSITFSEIMEFYPGHNRSVYEDLKKDLERKGLIPFVGAGLSVFCGYLGWSEVLKRLAGFVYDKGVRSKAEKLIADGELLQAAQEIYDHYPRMLKELQKLTDYNKIKNCEPHRLYASAAYALPYLFHDSFVITTNFDRVLEEVYDRCHKKFSSVINPYEPDLLTQARQSGFHCLFKLHGDIGPEIHDIERLVFTQAQYDKAYAADGALMQELPQWFQNKRLLFLGCSLAMDKTMEVLGQVTAKNPGLDHYAILECSPDEIGRRGSELGKLGISPIYYPPKRHEAVRVILERLLEETNHSAYEELSRYTQSHASAPEEKNRFMYDSEYIGFTGRACEMEDLHQFCRQSGQVLWWAVTGPGGMGKSRLVHEFAKQKKEEGWKIYWFNPQDYAGLSQLELPADRCIVVADDIQSHLQALGAWLTSVFAYRRSEKLRILLLEREGETLESARWAEMLCAESPYDDTVSAQCYCADFLHLKPLTEEELKTIMMNFAAVSGKPLVGNEHADRLLQTLQAIDKDLQRPMYALAIVDAWCNGEDPAHWNKEQLLEELVKRELKFYYGRLCNLSQKKISKETRSELEYLLARSCLLQFLPLESIAATEYPKLRRKADELDLDLFELLRQIGVVRKGVIRIAEKKTDELNRRMAREKQIEAVVLDCPDLVKEYMVLRQAFDKGQLSLVLPEGWDNNSKHLFFISQAISDYPEKLEGKNQFWKAFFAGNPREIPYAWMYGDLLFGVTAQLPNLRGQAVLQLEKLYQQFPADEMIGIEYARSLVNLTVGQLLEDRMQSVDKLRLLQERFPNSRGLAAEYAKGLVNLIVVQPLEAGVQSVDKLWLLQEQFPNSKRLALEYAKGLYNLAKEQELEDCIQNVAKLQMLWEDGGLRDIEEFVLIYAESLTNLSAKQSLEGCIQTIDKIKIVYEQSKENKKIVFVYAGSLVNLALAQTTETDVQETLAQSKALLEQYPKEAEIQLSYAQTKFNLTLVQSPDALCRTVAEIRDFLLEHPDANPGFQSALDKYLSEHPDHTGRYASLRI